MLTKRTLKGPMFRKYLIITIVIFFLYTSLQHFAEAPVDPAIEEMSNPNSEIRKFIKPHRLSDFEKLLLTSTIEENNYKMADTYLSKIVLKQIETIQNKNCDTPNLQCGHEDTCGFGCQLHQRIACLIMSYVTQLPLIHTVDCDGWYFSTRWSDIFLPLGSNCTPGPNTYVFRWMNIPLYLSDCRNKSAPTNTTGKAIPFVLPYGIPVDAEFGELIEKVHSDPFRWLVGQFTKYTMRVNTTFWNKLMESRAEVGFNNESPITGIQVRRTDKITEARRSIHEINTYIDEADDYFKTVEASHNSVLKRRVYVASENSSILQEAATMYPDWEVIGFYPKYSESDRKNGIYEVVRDLYLLSECDYVICGFSSNICRLVYELSYLHYGRPEVKSLDGVYKYELLYRTPRSQIWKIKQPMKV